MRKNNTKQSLYGLNFDNRFVQQLPADQEPENFRRQVENACYSSVLPAPASNPQLVAYAQEVADLLDLTRDACLSNTFKLVFVGNQQLPDMSCYATCYGGHQFGQWAGQLGDGRAINLGEVVNSQGQRWALQLKGAGATPYSRSADGLAVLRSSVREFLCSEAMYHLGVPTTRALSLITTGDQVMRDMFYNGNAKLEMGAVVCRVAPSFTRFGHFQLYSARKDITLLKQFVDYTITTDFPHLPAPSPQTYLDWFTEVCIKTAEMIVHWQRVGFVHGVMNTDNMSILGLTIDYGPYGWLEDYDPDWTPNTTDATGRRYRFGQQPQVAFWNLGQLANAIYPLINDVDLLQAAMDRYTNTFHHGWLDMMRSKLGLHTEQAEDEVLIEELLKILQLQETDMTLFYRQLANISSVEREEDNAKLVAPLTIAYYRQDIQSEDMRSQTADWLRQYIQRVQQEGVNDAERKKRMDAVNPKYVLRNYLAQLAIDKAEQGDNSLVEELLEVLRHPYDEQPDKQQFAQKRPDWARNRAGCSMLSCSS